MDIRNLDKHGRVIIPKKLLEEMELQEGDNLRIAIEEDGIKLYRTSIRCRVCGTVFAEEDSNILRVGGKDLCKDCIELIKGM